MNSSFKSMAALCLTAIIWGFAFIAQKLGMDSIGPLFFNAARSLIAFAALALVSLCTGKRKKAKPQKESKSVIKGGIICGIFLFFAMDFQQTGLVSTDAGKTGFITALYILLVPLISLFLGKKVTRNNWIGVIIGVAGLYLLCVTSDLHVETSDMIVLLGAFFWAGQILATDRYAPYVDVIDLSAIQFLVAGILSTIVAVFTEDISMAALMDAGVAILYVGIMSSAVAFTLQAYGQKGVNPTIASIILSTESLWAAIFGAIFLHEVMTGREYIGCILMFAAIIIAQIPQRRKRGLKE